MKSQIEYDDMCPDDQAVVDKLKTFLKNQPPGTMIIKRADGTKRVVRPIKLWTPDNGT